MKFEELTVEQIERAKACQSGEELTQLASEIGVELSDAELDEIAGGMSWSPKDALPKCPQCKSQKVSEFPMPGTGSMRCVCQDCGWQWTKTALDPILPG